MSNDEMRGAIGLLMMDNHIRLFSVINYFVSNYGFWTDSTVCRLAVRRAL